MAKSRKERGATRVGSGTRRTGSKPEDPGMSTAASALSMSSSPSGASVAIPEENSRWREAARNRQADSTTAATVCGTQLPMVETQTIKIRRCPAEAGTGSADALHAGR